MSTQKISIEFECLSRPEAVAGIAVVKEKRNNLIASSLSVVNFIGKPRAERSKPRTAWFTVYLISPLYSNAEYYCNSKN